MTVVLIVALAKKSSRSFAAVVVTDGAVIVAVSELYCPLCASIGVELFTPE